MNLNLQSIRPDEEGWIVTFACPASRLARVAWTALAIDVRVGYVPEESLDDLITRSAVCAEQHLARTQRASGVAPVPG